MSQMDAVRLLLIFSLIAPSLSIGEDVHLLEFKESLQSSSALDSTWIKGTNPCNQDKTWAGVDCRDADYQSVSALLLMNMGLNAVSEDLDIESLGNLQNLRVLSLENNSFSGPIPEFNRLSSLKSLFLSGNQFSGEIPPGYFEKMGSLKKLSLAKNKFSGKIPESLGKLGALMELMLQNNEFSGPIPSLEQKSLEKVDFSYNKLQGEIPQSLSNVAAQAFAGNTDLCGSAISKQCNGQSSSPPSPQSPPLPLPKEEKGTVSGMTKWIILAVVVTVLLVTILFKVKKKDQDFSLLVKEIPKENLDEAVQAVQVHTASTNRRSLSSSSHRRSLGGGGGGNSYNAMGSSSSKSRGSNNGKSVNDLVVINEEKGVFGLPDLMKAAAEVLGSGGLGSAYKATMANGVTVVVKRMRDMNKLNRDAFEVEIRKLGRIRHMNILPPLAYHYRKEEKLLITEFVPKGSLLFVLHGDRGVSHSDLNWPTRLKIIKGIARGMGFLHTEFANYELPHGNLKSSNILLSSNYEPLLTDYAIYSLISNTHSVQSLFAYKCPEAVLYQQLTPKSDVFCLGIVVLEIMTGKYPSQYLNNQKGGTDVVLWVRQAISENRVAELIDPEIANTADSMDEMEKMLIIGATCTESECGNRIEMREAIRSIEEVLA
ncbi:hypothetical protein BUALT_Bualt16G0039700 [Buddleja alternifolia]|uniref:Protein kinase domain-containing protein n=1 Tax=Buddleja alternifolia TaxID=168488 RepID=A0AAV6WFF7_9LAMI|nr:hypothetical protein BUALT_Bualt16G0039700 [Buddleja alternifolia]